MYTRPISKKALNTEDCLEIVAGISELKYSGDEELSKIQNFTLHEDNANIMFSIAKQVFRGTALTAKQYSLVKKLLVEYYTDQFDAHEIDLKVAVEKLRFPLRKIDGSHWIKFVEYKGEKMIAIRFPFNKKVIKHLEELKNATDKEYFYNKHTHYFPMKEKYIWKLVNLSKKFTDAKFEIENEILELYKHLEVFEQNPQDYIPGIYNFKFKNLPAKAIDNMFEDLGEPNYENLYKFYDRRHYYGLNYFDDRAILESIQGKETLTRAIMNRKTSLICVDKSKWDMSLVLKALDELERYPILILIDAKEGYNQVTQYHNLLRNYIPKEQMSVMFRLDSKLGNEAMQFNQYVKSQGLNNIVDKNTKIVYISNNKIPKPLMKSGFRPKGILTIGSKKVANNIDSYVSSHDLIIQYDDDASPHYSYGYMKADII
tara:strand:+ start:6443 stop:7729 length:1287 start_codon:yes stop_codon:yes gene_type:complete